MKLRIRGNSIRLRLTKGEVDQFSKTGLVEETVIFGLEPNQRFIYALSSSDNENLTAEFIENRINVLVPKPTAKEWTQTNEVGIRGEHVISDDKTLSILIEKDFACLEERSGEDESDAFPHPLIGSAC